MLHSYKYSVQKLRGIFESESDSAAQGLAVQTGLPQTTTYLVSQVTE